MQNINSEDVTLLPIINEELIEQTIYKFDDEFPNSIVLRPYFKDTLSKIKNNAFVIGAYYKGEIVGFSAIYINDFETNIAYITLIAVDSMYKRLHIGSKIMEYIKDISIINGFKKVKLEVHNNNPNAISFYKHHSFEIESVASEDSIYMICNIN